MLDETKIIDAYNRLQPYLNPTPLWSSDLLDEWLGHKIVFKIESFQKIGAFKYRGALNVLLCLKEQGKLPDEVFAFSSGNHAQAVALAAKSMGIKATIFMPRYVSTIKMQATYSYGANVVLTETRTEAEDLVKEQAAQGKTVIHPYDDDDIILGQATSCYEALLDMQRDMQTAPDAIIATCGGGGWISGTYLAAKLQSPNSKVFGAEPLNANDAARSVRDGKIFRFDETPETIADGARALSVSERTFEYLQKLDNIFEPTEEDIIYWTQWLTHLLKITIEPTSAVAMAGLHYWLKKQTKPQTALVMLSGGNISPESYCRIWQHNYLEKLPRI